MKKQKAYEDYCQKNRHLSTLGSIVSVLAWDQQVMLPKEGQGHRAKQIQTFSGLLHEMSTDKELGQLIHQLYDSGPDCYSAYEWRNIEQSYRGYEESVRIPAKLVEQSAALMCTGHTTWEESRENNDFESFAPVLEEWIELKKKMADCLYPDKEPYDVLLDGFERGLTQDWIDSIFSELQVGLLKLETGIENSKEPIPPFPSGNYSEESQKKLNCIVAKQLGFNLGGGRIDESAHPFSIGVHPSDVRVTTRYETDSFFTSLSSLCHECGHGMYEQGLMTGEYEDLPVAATLGIMVHESQSLLWERMVCQGKPFWKKFHSLAQEIFPEKLQNLNHDDFYRRVNRSGPCPIRINADEVTYPMHIILRYQLERDLFRGSLKVKDLPCAWNELSKKLLHINPENNSQGVLQDSHWAGGAFAYFPVYTLGAMMGFQLYQKADQEIPDLNEKLGTGEFTILRNWLKERIHQQGTLLEARPLLKKVTGKDLDCQAYLSYLNQKYSELYKL
jgi:carboxypeptidase Taq